MILAKRIARKGAKSQLPCAVLKVANPYYQYRSKGKITAPEKSLAKARSRSCHVPF